MKRHACMLALALAGFTAACLGQKVPLDGEFDLAKKSRPETRYFRQETVVFHFSPDGAAKGSETYRMTLKCIPAEAPPGSDDQAPARSDERCICGRFEIRRGENPFLEIPSMRDWTYIFRRTPGGMDEEGRVFGVPHDHFTALKDATGQNLMPDMAYAVYNSFIDFHGFCYVFAEPVAGGKGIQDLHRIGDRIIHAAAFTEPPVHVGDMIKPGSTFKNGEVSLTFKGLSRKQGKTCALVGFDSGESSFKMLLEPMPGMAMQAVGRSHYFGDIYLDLKTGNTLHVDLGEVVATEASLPMPPNKINEIVERKLTIRAISQEEYESGI
ncbi:hypothetical protein JW906_06540 [bacterium]|nr:hypothetical protein [bacterium]